jgi:hypothetical protein
MYAPALAATAAVTSIIASQIAGRAVRRDSRVPSAQASQAADERRRHRGNAYSSGDDEREQGHATS